MRSKSAAINIRLLRSLRKTTFECVARALVATGFVLFLSSLATGQPSINKQKTINKRKAAVAIRRVLERQAAAWNRGDIDGYMDGYDRSPNTEFVSGDTINRGWQAVLDRYKQHYDSREKMGALTFSDLEITLLSKDAALALGRWRLKRPSDEPHGTFTLLFRKTKAGWRIVHDHTSSA